MALLIPNPEAGRAAYMVTGRTALSGLPAGAELALEEQTRVGAACRQLLSLRLRPCSCWRKVKGAVRRGQWDCFHVWDTSGARKNISLQESCGRKNRA